MLLLSVFILDVIELLKSSEDLSLTATATVGDLNVMLACAILGAIYGRPFS